MSSGIYFPISMFFMDLSNLNNLLPFCFNRDDLALSHLPTIILMSLMCIFACILRNLLFYMHAFSGLCDYCYIFNCVLLFLPSTLGLRFIHVALYLHITEEVYHCSIVINRKKFNAILKVYYQRVTVTDYSTNIVE